MTTLAQVTGFRRPQTIAEKFGTPQTIAEKFGTPQTLSAKIDEKFEGLSEKDKILEKGAVDSVLFTMQPKESLKALNKSINIEA